MNQDHYINRILHNAGDHELTIDEFDTPHVLVAIRILVDPADPDDVKAVVALQDRFALTAASAVPFAMPEYDNASFDETRHAVLGLAKGASSSERAFGPKDDVDPIRHLLLTAAGWGGLPDAEARYVPVDPRLPLGEYKLTVRDVPEDGFWSVSVYNADGFFEPNDRGAYSINNLTAATNDDGSVTINFGGCADDRPNCLPITEGWNYVVRLYRPRSEVLDGTWIFPGVSGA